MQRVNRATAVTTMPAPPAGGTPGYFTGGNPGLGEAATTPGYEWFNSVQEELIGVLVRAGITPAQADLTQLRKALDRLYGGGISTLSVNTTLTANEIGTIEVSALSGPLVITLPPVGAMNGRPMLFRVVKIDGTANPVTVQRVGTDTIEGATSIVLNELWSSAWLISNGYSTWFNVAPKRASAIQRGIARFATTAETDVGAVADAVITPAGLAGAMGKLLAANGFQRLPGGLIIQWGATNFSDIGAGGVNVSATFPMAFPGAVLNVLGSEGTTNVGNFSIITASWTLTGVTFALNEWSAVVQNAQVRYLAIGY